MGPADHYPKALWVDLIDPENMRFYSAAPERLRQTVAARRARSPVVVDEVQRVPQLLPVVHQLIELDKSLVFVLNVARECQVERKVVAGYVDILQDLLLAFTLPVFTRGA